MTSQGSGSNTCSSSSSNRSSGSSSSSGSICSSDSDSCQSVGAETEKIGAVSGAAAAEEAEDVPEVLEKIEGSGTATASPAAGAYTEATPEHPPIMLLSEARFFHRGDSVFAPLSLISRNQRRRPRKRKK